MTDLTREQHLKLAAGAAKLLRDHGIDIADIASDIPKLIGIGHDMRTLVEDVKAAGPASSAPPPVPTPGMVTTPAPSLGPGGTPIAPIPSAAAAQPHLEPKPSAPAARPVTAHQVAHAVAQDGLTPAERAMFARADGGSGG